MTSNLLVRKSWRGLGWDLFLCRLTDGALIFGPNEKLHVLAFFSFWEH